MKLFTLCTFFIFLASCCQKKYCVTAISAPVGIKLEGFANSIQSKAYLVDKADYAVIDSVNIHDNSLSLDIYTFGNSNELKDHNVIIKTPATSDTFYNITYNLAERRGCNSCLFNKDDETYTVIENHSVEHKRKKYTAFDTIVITP